jgi:dTDP-4-amino-4,6-dideoxygalactose transaminase
VPGVRTPRSMPGNRDVWHLYVVRVLQRDRVLAELAGAGIGAGIHYPVPLHLTEAYRHLGHRAGDFPVAERAAAEMVSLPIFPHLRPEQQDLVVAALRVAVGAG